MSCSATASAAMDHVADPARKAAPIPSEKSYDSAWKPPCCAPGVLAVSRIDYCNRAWGTRRQIFPASLIGVFCRCQKPLHRTSRSSEEWILDLYRPSENLTCPICRPFLEEPEPAGDRNARCRASSCARKTAIELECSSTRREISDSQPTAKTNVARKNVSR